MKAAPRCAHLWRANRAAARVGPAGERVPAAVRHSPEANPSEGVAMKRFAKKVFCAVLCLCFTAQSVFAWGGSWSYGGYQPWYNIFAHRNKCLTCEEERLQRFWHDY